MQHCTGFNKQASAKGYLTHGKTLRLGRQKVWFDAAKPYLLPSIPKTYFLCAQKKQNTADGFSTHQQYFAHASSLADSSAMTARTSSKVTSGGQRFFIGVAASTVPTLSITRMMAAYFSAPTKLTAFIFPFRT